MSYRHDMSRARVTRVRTRAHIHARASPHLSVRYLLNRLPEELRLRFLW